MANILLEIRHFFRELNRRRTVQVAIAYAVAAWIIIEISSVILPAFEAPAWALQLIIATCVIGFPIALILSWIYDLTTKGLVRTADLDNSVDGDGSPSRTSQSTEQIFAERRQVTVLRYTIRCSSDNGSQLDAESLREILPLIQHKCAEIIDNFNGHLSWSRQDEGEAIFGYPIALEHDARSAIQCAIELRDGIGDVKGEDECVDSTRIRLSAAIHTGQAITEFSKDKQDAGELTGEFSRIMARLLDLAPPGAVVINKPTYVLVRDFYDLQKHEDVQSGQSTNETYIVDKERDALIYRSDFSLPSGHILGRDHEIALLKDRWERAVTGTGQTVSIVGEPGIGKSALVHKMIEFCSTYRDAVIAECNCTPFNQNVSLYPIAHLFRYSLLGLTSATKPEDQLTSIEEFLTRREFEVEEAAPLLARFLSIPFESRYPPIDLSPEQIKETTLELIIQLLLKRAHAQPVLLIIEDLHWSDVTTLDLIERIIDHGPEARLLFLLTYRPELDPAWSTRTDVTRVSLANLTPDQAVELVRNASADAELSIEIQQKIVAHSDGVPLFLEELTRAVIDTASESGSMDSIDIPTTLQDTLMARLDRLGRAKRVAQKAAIFGREFSFQWIEALMKMDAKSLQEDLKTLVASGLTYRRGKRSDSRFIFKHALIQEAASSSLLRRDRHQIHQEIATLFSETFADYGAGHPQIVAWHYACAGSNEKAIPLYIKAAQSAQEHSAYPEAVNQLQAGLDLISGVPQSRSRDTLELSLQAGLARVMTATQGYAADEVEQRWLRAIELASELGDTGNQVGLMMGQWQSQISQGHLLQALEQSNKMLQLVHLADLSSSAYPIQTAAGITQFHLGELAQAELYFEQLSNEYEIDKNRQLALTYGQDPFAACLAWYAISSWLRGFPEKARQQISTAVDQARSLEHPFSLAYVLRRSLTLLYYAKDEQAMQTTIAELEQLAGENSFSEVLVQANFWHSITGYKQSINSSKIHHASDIVSQYHHTGANLNLCYSQGLVAEQFLLAGDFSDALQNIEVAVSNAEQSREMWCASDLNRLHGDIELAIDPGDTITALAAYQRALEIAIEQDAKFFELRARLALGRVYKGLNDTEKACEVLAPAPDLISDGTIPDHTELAELQLELQAL